MNDVLKTIEKRRSTRGFSSEQISENDLKVIMKAGLYAPTAMNAQNWHFTVVQKPELIEEINNKVKTILPPELNQRMLDRFNGDPNYSVAYYAPTLVFTFAEENNSYAPLNCSFASQNIVLASESLGYNSCYIGMLAMLFQDESYYEKLGVPKGYKIATVIALGKGNKEMPVPEKDLSKINYII
ncbi:MAG: nitroreductase family protein [Lachnospirales bacterium]